jgi:hypothetical protein
MPTKFEYECIIHLPNGQAVRDSVESTDGNTAKIMMESRYPGGRVSIMKIEKVSD